MREDMNKYNTSYTPVPSQRTEGEFSQTAGATAKTVGGMVWRTVKTLLWICAIAGVLVFLSVVAVILSFRNTVPPDINAMSLKYSSYVYIDAADGTSSEYTTFHSTEDRKWVPLDQIPQAMQTAQVAIEDHRFFEHEGVDWHGTLGAVYKLFSHTGGGGGSTLTQQLIKNITGKNQVSLLRKIGEIFTALNLEGGYTDSSGKFHQGYSKEEILEAYLNVVNYGGTCQGVQAAANHYFDKDISQCSLAECAMIAGITQNPYKYNPVIFPENAKKRAEDVLFRMLELSTGGDGSEDFTDPHLMKITQSEYDAALQELETIRIVGVELEETDVSAGQDLAKWNWYIDLMFDDLVADLEEKGYSRDFAVDKIYNGGLEIHTSVNMELQKDLENYFLTNTEMLPEDESIELGFCMVDPYTGKVMAVIGSRYKRDGVRLWNNASDSKRPSGSAIKPISPYAVGLNTGAIDYGSVLKDEPIPDYFGEGSTQEGPQNFSMKYTGNMNVDKAIEVSQNAPAAWLCKTVTPEACYDWLTNSLHFTTLTEEDSHELAPMSLGGQSYGVTVREMTAAYQIYCNGGVYHKPITYDYVKDHDGNVILDNRPEANPGEQVMTVENATIMNKLLHRPTYGPEGTATLWTMDLNGATEVIGKTGTTDDTKDLWFVGATPFCVAGIWNGYKNPAELSNSGIAKTTWFAVIQHLLEKYDWSGKSWVLSENVTEHMFCRSSGKLAGPNCYDVDKGWYDAAKTPGTCNGGSDHIYGKKVSPSPSVSPGPSAEPSMSPSPTPSAEPTVSPSPGTSSGEEPVSSSPSSEVQEPTPTPGVTDSPTPEPPPPPIDETPPPPVSSQAEETPEPFVPDVPPDGGNAAVE